MSAWLTAFVFTQVIEIPIYMRALLERLDGGEPVVARWSAALGLAFGASAITHPIVWFVMPKLVPSSWLTMVIIAELFAILTEAAWLRAFGLRRSLAWAAFANAASVLIGMALRQVFGWP
ncbi:hypothetical protein ENSA5_04970 [Enhygromyxa salina]|uniref:CAAX amino terminal protease self-immunity n=1 Tax=Enhygromyxa salina TaxID=215803 RepID=A0A2S9YI60_9BACT|nr:hypothetical protein [Enhygromyxa salina]PRQ04732.1 hypothetical protein ENSA5_04970 [Enhygromyxa salina]